MPLYEYQCQQCGNRTEVLQRFDDAPLTVCTVCGGALKKLLSAPAVQFKGSGWYVTDYAGKSSSGSKSGGEGGKDKADSGSKGSSAGASSDSSSAAPAAATPKSSGGSSGD